MNVLFASGAATARAQTSSASNSQPSATPVPDAVTDAAFRRAVAEALDELRAARRLIGGQDIEIKTLKELNEAERTLSDGYKNLAKLNADQVEELKLAIAAKDRVIAAVEAQNALLKKNQWSLGKAVKWFIIGGASGIIAATVLKN